MAARRVAAAGAAVHLPGHQADAATVRAAIEKLLADDRYTTAARRLRAEMHDRPTPAALVRTLTDLAF